jgi:2-polyprenyl-6-methoxyphenol hydroxylase-like FAD-dependent oxidoreductase
MSVPNEVEALVVGAGPVGLAAAVTLSQLGRQVAIVDSSVTTRTDSRAGVVHSRTLEVCCCHYYNSSLNGRFI